MVRFMLAAHRPAQLIAGLLLVVTLAFAVAGLAGNALAQDAEAPSDTAIDSLLTVLQDPAQRDELIQQLETIRGEDAGGATPAEAVESPETLAEEVNQDAAIVSSDISEGLDALGGSLVDTAAKAVAAIGDQLANFAALFANLPKLLSWFVDVLAVGEQEKFNRLVTFLSVLGTVAAIGLTTGYLANLFTKRLRAKAMPRVGREALRRGLASVSFLIMDLLVIAAAATAARITLEVLDPAPRTLLIVFVLVIATIMSRAAIAVLKAVLAPKEETLRVLPISEETARYLYIWGRRIAIVAIYGHFIGGLFAVNGMPAEGYVTWNKLVGLLVAIMVILIILQNQQSVEDWIRGLGYRKSETDGEDENQDVLPGLGDGDDQPAVTASTEPAPAAEKDKKRNALRVLQIWVADLWHIFAIFYVVLVFGTWSLEHTGQFRFLAFASAQTVILVGLGFLVTRLKTRLLERLFAIPKDLSDGLPNLEVRANRYLPALKAIFGGIIWIGVVLGVLSTWGTDFAAWLLSSGGLGLIRSLVSLLIISLIAVAVWELVSSAIERKLQKLEGKVGHLERAARLRTLLPLIRTVFSGVLAVVVGLIFLSEIGVNIAPLLAGAGIVGVAVGFGSQKLVQDVITGLFILIEDQVSVGDYIDTGSHGGTVEKINLRTIRLRDLSGTVHIVPFSEVASVKNFSREFGYAVIDMGVAYRENVDEVMALMERIGEELQADPDHGPNILEPIAIFGVNELGDSAVVIRGRLKTAPMMQWSVKRAYLRLAKLRFDEHNIEIPFPHQTMYFGELKDGTAPPAYIVNSEGPREADGDDTVVPISEEEKERAVAKVSSRPTDDDATDHH
ncbi:MAG: mechanosensitive ion channel [Alphaproteobacteria bacterium]|nr:mechanosensitive ion channel [Alphaproteobacteria bacterium SS10]